ncbi:hypothetical protein DLJ61_17970 [Gordonia terrae]|uniref:Uncharacterized protein n=2 Tax=Gordonia terrae TaxID=2055 RepID=A0AAD0NYC2_9ACTN|nr:hypothetical protein DLJ61_17970 [Gordonia terrae]GAB46779.1 hypothetical protein GOTRE_181_00580 [Gordonia terrae NBRC 100016]VTR10854.1 Uncharacterised protein [Clostridioides difficile]
MKPESVRDERRRHRDDPAALELLAIREWASELAQRADAWLEGRERLRERQANEAARVGNPRRSPR